MTRPAPRLLGDMRAAARRLGPRGGAALLALLVAAWTLAGGFLGLARAVFARSPAPADAFTDPGERANAFHDAFAGHLAQINGRSMFFVPRPLPPPPAERSEAPSPPPPPSRYAGPAVVAMINGAVWLDNGRRLTLDDAERAGLRLIALNPPWSARLEWNGREWDVPLFDRTTGQFLEPLPSTNAADRATEKPADAPHE
jgi:hypothetical protein